VSNRRKFTVEKKARYLALVASGVQLGKAAQAVGMSARGVMDHRQADLDFAQAVNDAWELGTQTLEEEARRRAFEGVTSRRAILHRGQVIGYDEKTEYSDTLLIFLLKGRRPDVYRERTENINRNDTNEPITEIEAVRPATVGVLPDA
jgi:hypothetical protein